MRTAEELAGELRRQLSTYRQRSDTNGENIKGAEFFVNLAEALSHEES